MGVIGALIKWGVRLGSLVLALTIGAVMYFSHANLKTYGEGRGLDAPVDAVLVLGGGIDGDGVLGFSSRRRVWAAVSLLETGKARHLIFSGGPDWRQPESSAAALMRAHAVALGAPPDALLAEVLSKSTFQNIRFGFALAEREGFSEVALLTDAFHLERTRWLVILF